MEPSAFCYAFGADYRSVRYFRLDPVGTEPAEWLESIKAFLAAGFASMFGFPVYPEYDFPLRGGLIAYPSPGSRSRGGHCERRCGL